MSAQLADSLSGVFLASVPVNGHPGVFENAVFQGVGLAVVMVSLGALAIAVTLIGAAMTWNARKPTKASEPAGDTVPFPVASGVECVPPEVVAVIAAAVHATVRQPHRIVRINPPHSPWLQAWSAEGRRQIFQSHSVR